MNIQKKEFFLSWQHYSFYIDTEGWEWDEKRGWRDKNEQDFEEFLKNPEKIDMFLLVLFESVRTFKGQKKFLDILMELAPKDFPEKYNPHKQDEMNAFKISIYNFREHAGIQEEVLLKHLKKNIKII